VAQQLIFTSVPRGYQPGASGYCTAARSEQMRSGLVQRLEQMSVYSHRTVFPNPTILAYRLVDLGGVKYRVLSRIRDAGLDFTQRSNFIAHHLAFEPNESVGGASPAEILLFWDGWKDQWEGNPSAIQDEKGDAIGSSVNRLSPPCKHWEDLTGDSGWGAFPWNQSGGCCWFHEKLDEFELLHLMGESLRLKSSGRIDALWETSFTTYLGTIVEASKYHWSAWNALDPIPVGKELGKNVIRIESLKGDPIGSKELIEIARRGFTSSGATSGTKQPQSNPKEVKTQTEQTVPKWTPQRKEGVTRSFIPDAKDQKNYFPFLVGTIAVATIMLAVFLYNKNSERNQRDSDAALIKCIESISENLSSSKRPQQAPNYSANLTEEQLRCLGEKNRDLMKVLDEEIRDLNENKESAETVLNTIKSVEYIATTSETQDKVAALKAMVLKWRQEKREAKSKTEISAKIHQITQSETYDYEHDRIQIQEIKRDWNNEISEPFPYEYIQEIVSIAKELALISAINTGRYDQLIERLEAIQQYPEARPYALKIIQHERGRLEKDERIPATQFTESVTVYNPEVRKYDNIVLEALFDKKLVENLFKKIPNGSVSYLLEDNLKCPVNIRDSLDIFKVETKGKSDFRSTPVRGGDIFDENGYVKNAYRQELDSGIILTYSEKGKTNIIVYKLNKKPCSINVDSSEKKNEIFSEVENIKKHLEKTIICDGIGHNALRWSVAAGETDKTCITDLGSLDPQGIWKISDTIYEGTKKECLNEFKRFDNAITIEKIESLWEKRPLIFTNNTIKNIDETAQDFLREKEDYDNKSQRSTKYSEVNLNAKDPQALAKEIKKNIQAILNKQEVWSDLSPSDIKTKQAETFDQLGEGINIKVNQTREYLLLPPAKNVMETSRNEYKDININKNNKAIIAAWQKYQKYVESKKDGDQPQHQKEYEWFTKKILSNNGDFKLYLGPGDLRYFQINSD
jgi:GTPase-associated protein 1, N-terminal domain type 2